MARFIIGLLITFMTMGGVGWYYTSYLPHKSLDLPDPDESAAIPVEAMTSLDIQQMLRNKDYDNLNKVLARAKKVVADDFSQENILFDFYGAFQCHDDSFEGLLNEWKTQYPQKYQPYLASAYYYTYLGWESRGSKWIKDTKKEQIKKMMDYFQKADADIDEALRINSKLLPAYYLQINISNSLGDYKTEPLQRLFSIAKLIASQNKSTFVDFNETREHALKKALEMAPYSLNIRTVYIFGLEPRWGGSYQKMDTFAAASQKYADVNPRLKILMGYSYYDKGYTAYLNDNYPAAIELYTKALSYGDYGLFYNGRSEAYFYWGDSGKALPDIERAIELRPMTEDYYVHRAMIYYYNGDVRQAVSDLSIAQGIRPDDGGTLWGREHILEKIVKEAHSFYQDKNYQKAVEQYELVLTVGASKYYDLYYWQGLAYMNMGDYTHAAEKLQIAADVFPNNYEYHTTLDKVLTRSHSWDPLITAWGGYITSKPKDSNGYMQRCTAYLHKGDYESAMADAKQAADLGSTEGQTKYEQIAKKLGK